MSFVIIVTFFKTLRFHLPFHLQQLWSFSWITGFRLKDRDYVRENTSNLNPNKCIHEIYFHKSSIVSDASLAVKINSQDLFTAWLTSSPYNIEQYWPMLSEMSKCVLFCKGFLIISKECWVHSEIHVCIAWAFLRNRKVFFLKIHREKHLFRIKLAEKYNGK